MKSNNHPCLSHLRGVGIVSATVAVLAILAGCNSSENTRDEPVANVSSAVFTNGGFETGDAGLPPPSWTVQPFINNGITVQTPQTRAGLDLATGGNAITTILYSATGAGQQPDPDLGTGAALRWPRYGNQCAIVNFHSSSRFGNPQNVNSMSQTMTVGSGDVDPTDGKVHVRFVVAPVLQNPSHAANQQPYYFVQLTDVTQSNAILYTDFNLSAQAGVPWQTVNGGTAQEIDYTDWSLVDITPSNSTLAMGDQVKLEVIASGCSPSGHFGELYVDGVGSTVPGLFISGTGPSQANAGTNITYTFTYSNGSSSSESGVAISVTTPPNTTYQSFTAPTGITCTPPTVGAAGTLTCNVTGAVAAGTGGSFTVTVNITTGTTGTITEGTYSVQSSSETALSGPKIVTIVGCTLDSQCPIGQWCNESGAVCTPTLANGVVMPTDGTHTNPTLNGTCTMAAGALVCTSAVCDTDNKCGYADGDGSCTPGTGGNGGVVCRSGHCSTSGKCEPNGGCLVDADCSSAQWCNETSRTCTAKVTNGNPVPTDGAHTNPTLNGTCAAGVGVVVCTSGVCDTSDNDCGYADGHGPCTAGDGGDGAIVCRSGSCSTTGTCKPSNACNVDADCSSTQWCNETTHTCTMKVSNGNPVPTDGAHTNPTLNGTCSTGVGPVVCMSAVCDTDNDCGYANGHGPCTTGDAGDGTVVCRSGACSTDGTCEPSGGCNVDADCTDPSKPICDNHVCVPNPDAGPFDAGSDASDSGAMVDAGNDAGHDAGQDAGPKDAGTDAGHVRDATTDAADEGGFVEGGGCAVGRASNASPPTTVGLFAFAAIAVGARRRRVLSGRSRPRA